MTRAQLGTAVRWIIILLIVLILANWIFTVGLRRIFADAGDKGNKVANCAVEGGCPIFKTPTPEMVQNLPQQSRTSSTGTTRPSATPTPIPAADPRHPVTLSSNPGHINPGGRTLLTWDVGQGATEVWLYWHPVVDQGEVKIEKIRVNPQGHYPRRLDATTFFWVEATYTDGTKSAKGWTVCVDDSKCTNDPVQ